MPLTSPGFIDIVKKPPQAPIKDNGGTGPSGYNDLIRNQKAMKFAGRMAIYMAPIKPGASASYGLPVGDSGNFLEVGTQYNTQTIELHAGDTHVNLIAALRFKYTNQTFEFRIGSSIIAKFYYSGAPATANHHNLGQLNQVLYICKQIAIPAAEIPVSGCDFKGFSVTGFKGSATGTVLNPGVGYWDGVFFAGLHVFKYCP